MAIDLFFDDGRAGNQHLKALAPHGLDEHRHLHGAAGLHVEDAGGVRVLDLDGDVGLELPVEAVPQLAGGHELALAAHERPVIDAELHLERRRVYLAEGQGVLVLAGGDRVADVDVLEAREADDVSGGAGLGLGRA